MQLSTVFAVLSSGIAVVLAIPHPVCDANLKPDCVSLQPRCTSICDSVHSGEATIGSWPPAEVDHGLTSSISDEPKVSLSIRAWPFSSSMPGHQSHPGYYSKDFGEGEEVPSNIPKPDRVGVAPPGWTGPPCIHRFSSEHAWDGSWPPVCPPSHVAQDDEPDAVNAHQPSHSDHQVQPP